MLKIDLRKIIDSSELIDKQVAEALFPSNKHPKPALDRVIAGEAHLDSAQLSKLATMLNCTVSELYSGGRWKSKAGKKIHVFTSGEYRAELDLSTMKTTIYHNDSVFHEQIVHSESIRLSEYLAELDSIIKTNT